jgi:type II secretory pathway component PulF
MEKFKYEARDKEGNLVTGVETAVDRDQVIAKLRHSELYPISIVATSNYSINIIKGKIKFNDNELIFFTRQVSNLLDSGLPLAKAIHLLTNQTNNPKIKKICAKLHAKISEGGYLWQAMAQYPESFDKAYIGMVKAAELGANMEQVFENLADYLERKKDVKDAVISMLLYPIIIFIIGIITVFFLMTFIVPKMAFMFDAQQISLPLITKLLLSTSTFLSKYWMFVILGVVLIVLVLRQLYVQKNVKVVIDKYLYELPLVGQIFGQIAFSKFSYIVGLLSSNGMSIIECLDISREVLPNQLLKKSMSSVIEKVKAGGSLSASMKQDAVFPLVMVDMIGIGEQTGQLEKALHKVSISYDKQVKQQLKQLLNILEPAIILLIALVVGFLVGAILLPIFQFNLQSF